MAFRSRGLLGASGEQKVELVAIPAIPSQTAERHEKKGRVCGRGTAVGISIGRGADPPARCGGRGAARTSCCRSRCPALAVATCAGGSSMRGGARWRRRGRVWACRVRRPGQRDDGIRLHRLADEVGEYSWTLVSPDTRGRSPCRPRGSLASRSRSRRCWPIVTWLAVSGVYLRRVVIDHPFRIHVGATCTAGCDLKGKEIQGLRRDRPQHRARGVSVRPLWDGNPGALLDRGRPGCSRQGGCDLAVDQVRTGRSGRLPRRRSVGSIRIRDSQAAAALGDGQGRAEGRRSAVARTTRCAWAFTSLVRTCTGWEW